MAHRCAERLKLLRVPTSTTPCGEANNQEREREREREKSEICRTGIKYRVKKKSLGRHITCGASPTTHSVASSTRDVRSKFSSKLSVCAYACRAVRVSVSLKRSAIGAPVSLPDAVARVSARDARAAHV